jgi:hypothetical protein
VRRERVARRVRTAANVMVGRLCGCLFSGGSENTESVGNTEIRKYVKLCNSDKTLDFTLFTVK